MLREKIQMFRKCGKLVQKFAKTNGVSAPSPVSSTNTFLGISSSVIPINRKRKQRSENEVEKDKIA